MNILLAVTGSISAYKSVDIARGLINQGHTVRVVLSQGALEFVNPNVFKYLGVDETYLPTDDFKYKNVLHIELSRWLDSFVLCPASANTIAKLSSGLCDDLLSSVFISLEPDKVKLIFPAMNTQMYQNPRTKENLHRLQYQIKNIYVIEPDSGLLVCGETGEGKLPPVPEVIDLISTHTPKKHIHKVIITAGATISSLDDVRYITNPAKGGTSYLLAKKFLSEGYRVHIIKGRNVIPEFKNLEKHKRYSFDTVTTTQDLYNLMVKYCVEGHNWHYYFSPMAVSDIEFEYQSGKIKKSQMNEPFKFKPAPDVLKYVLENKKKHHFIVGFAAEAELTKEVLTEKILRKPVDLLVANEVNSGMTGQPKKGFGTREGNYKLLYRDFEDGKYDSDTHNGISKEELVNLIFNWTKEIVRD